MAGSATYKQSKNSMKLCYPLRSVCLFSLFSQKKRRKKRICFFGLFRRKNGQLMAKMSSPKLHSAPLKETRYANFQVHTLFCGLLLE